MMNDTRGRNLAWTGLALTIGGALTVLLNAALTPFLPTEGSAVETVTSGVFIWRQGLSALAALFLLAGSVGVHMRQIGSSGRLGSVSFALTFAGCALLFAAEWCQVLFVRDLALRAPETFEALESASGPSASDVGIMSALLVFSVGWLLLSVSMLRARVFARRGPVLVLAGLLASLVLGPMVPGVWGAVAGSMLVGVGWMQLGRELHAAGVSFRP